MRARTRHLTARAGRAAARMLGSRAELRLERALLKRSWGRSAARRLETYLVSGYQSPLINIQSILARHHFVHLIAGDRFRELERAELEFAIAKNRALRAEQKRRGAKPGQRDKSVTKAFTAVMGDDGTEFMDRWRRELSDLAANRTSVLEAACGSANDYRFMVDCGLAAHLDYRGFDLTEANIANARAAYPDVDFRLGDVLNIDAADASFDWVVVHDLFEHLSPTACEQAIAEVSRVARDGVLVSFFHMADIPEHEIKPLRQYHRNRLSLNRTREAFLTHCQSVDAVRVSRFVNEEFGLRQYYNKGAYTFVVRK